MRGQEASAIINIAEDVSSGESEREVTPYLGFLPLSLNLGVVHSLT